MQRPHDAFMVLLLTELVGQIIELRRQLVSSNDLSKFLDGFSLRARHCESYNVQSARTGRIKSHTIATSIFAAEYHFATRYQLRAKAQFPFPIASAREKNSQVTVLKIRNPGD